MIVVTGAGHALEACDPSPYLLAKKSRKFMGIQDDLAVVGAGRALADAALSADALGENAGIYLAVGYIPFQEEDIAPVLASSLDEQGRFSMARFSAGGFQRAHPLLTFRCLPNMPAYHVSVNFGIRGPYLVVYPGIGAFYLALEEASAAIAEGRVEVALLGGVAHQRNFLVEHHFQRIVPPVAPGELRDAGAWLVLESERHAVERGARIRGRLESVQIAYEPFDPARAMPAFREELDPPHATAGELGPASLAAAISLAESHRGALRHAVQSREGIRAESTWSLEP